jgi:Cu-processing system permease protein
MMPASAPIVSHRERSAHASSRFAGTAVANIAAVAGRELREAFRSRWFILYTLAFAALGLGVSYISAVASGASGLSGFGRTSAGLVNMVLLVVPLMGLTAGAGAIASDRERGMLAYLLAQPVTRWEVLLGKYLGLAAALGACICLGLGTCAGVLAWKGATTDPASLISLAALTFVLGLAMLSVGMLISVLARKASVATGTAVFTWLALALVTDLGLMAGVLALRMRIENLFALSLVNPLQVFKMWTLHAADASLDVLGPAGLYADDRFGTALPWVFAVALGAWIVGPLVISGFIFARRSIT